MPNFNRKSAPDPYELSLAEIEKLRGPGAYVRDLRMHSNANRRAASALAPYFGETLTSLGLQGVGLGNELADIVKGAFSKNPQYGRIESSDLAANKLGIDYGLADARARSLRRQHGGKVPNKGGAQVRVPATWIIQKMQGGGQTVPLPNRGPNKGTGGIMKPKLGGKPARQKAPLQTAAPTPAPAAVGGAPVPGGYMGQVSGTANSLANYNPNIQAQTGQMNQTAQTLSNFNPLQGAAGNTLQGIIATGNAVNTDPIVQAAQTRAQQGFQDFTGQANEQFGALGLGSSSARTAAIAREAGRLQQGVAATGMEAEVAAQENARMRQLQAFNPLLQGSGQQLSGIQSAGDIYGRAAGLNLDAQTSNAGMRLSGLQSAGNLQMGQAGLVSSERQAGLNRNLTREQMGAAAADSEALRRAAQQQRRAAMEAQYVARNGPRGGGGSSSGRPVGSMRGTVSPLTAMRWASGGKIPPYASGGRVDEGDFLSEALYGVKFKKERGSGSGPVMVRGSSRGPGNGYAPRQMVYYDGGGGGYRDPYEGIQKQMLREQLQDMQRPRHSDFRERQAALNYLSMLGGETAKGFGANVRPGSRAVMGLNFGGGSNLMGLFNEGGVIPGPSVPPDQVPILAQGGEGIIPVKLMHRLETAKRPKQLASVAREIQQLMGKEPQLNDKDIQRKQRGGKIAKVMGEFKAGSLKSSDGKAVTDRKQAIAIALEMARREGEAQKMASGGTVFKRPSFEFFPTFQPIPTQEGNEKMNFVGPPEPEQPAFEIQGNAMEMPEVSTGRFISPTEDAEKLYQDARGRSALLRTLALQSPRGALSKLAPLIATAQEEEGAALENLQLTQDRLAKMQEAEATRGFTEEQNRLNRESAEKVAGIKGEAQVGAAEARNPMLGMLRDAGPPPQSSVSPAPQQQGAMMGAPQQEAQMQPPQGADPIAAALSMGPDRLEEGVRSLLSRPDFRPTSELRAVAVRALQQLVQSMSDEELLAKYPALIQMAS